MGTKWPCQRHAEAFAALPGVELAAVAELDPALRARYVKMFGGRMQAYADYREMLAAAKLDAVVIGLPTWLHTEATMASFDAGAHVLCEKPPTTNTAEMVRIAARARRLGLTYMFCRQTRFLAASLRARDLVAAGKLGEVYHADAKWLRTRYLPTNLDNWRVSLKRGGGVLLDLGIHAIDGAWFVMGCPQPVEVLAGMHCKFGHFAPKGQDYSADDAAMGMIRFENGATLQFSTSFSLNWAPQGATAAGNGGRKAINSELREVTVFGTDGGVDVLNGLRIVGRRNGVRMKPLGGSDEPAANGARAEFVRQARDFLLAIRQGTPPTNSAEQAVMLMQMLDALKVSGETRKAVRIRRASVRASSSSAASPSK